MPILDDGTVIPSTIQAAYTPNFSPDEELDGNVTLRLGEVQRAVWPDDKDSISKKFIEYDVFVQHVANGTATTKLYENCALINSFGGLSDKYYFTLRGEDAAKDAKKNSIGRGSKVLVLCVNGSTSKAVIIGGVRNDTDLKDDKDLGHHLYWMFNGISASINKEGELTLTYNGKTEIDGKRNKDVKEDVTGTNVSFLKNGNVQIATKDDKQHILIDHENGQIHIKGDQKVIIKSGGVEVGDATDKWLLASTYRDAESQLNKNLADGIQKVMQKMTQIGAFLTAAGAGLTSGIPGAYTAAAAPLTNAGAQMLQVTQDLAKMYADIQTFEGKADTYLSKVNKND